MSLAAPILHRGLVAAGLKDINRDPSKLSVPQNIGAYIRPLAWASLRVAHRRAALAATGFIWVRYSFVVRYA
jgi:hypothetical protein